MHSTSWSQHGPLTLTDDLGFDQGWPRLTLGVILGLQQVYLLLLIGCWVGATRGTYRIQACKFSIHERWVSSPCQWVEGTKVGPLFVTYVLLSYVICNLLVVSMNLVWKTSGVPEAIMYKNVEGFRGILGKDLRGVPRHLGVRPWRVSLSS